MVGFICLGKMTFGGENAAVHPSPTPSTENLGAGWSFDLNSAYTFGSRIQKSANLEFEAIAGWTFQRTYDYVRSGPDYYSKGAPYFRVELSLDLF